ncbi:MAG: 4-hydroxy-tetrahydrodipicolinate reductase [Verrucomicrobiota bacterium]
MNTLRISLIGAGGRMGNAICAAVQNDSELTIAAKCDLGDELNDAAAAGDVVIDFSSVEASKDVCQACLRSKKPLVIGTTGHSADQREFIATAAESLPIVFAPNFSVGVNTLFWLTGKAAELLGPDFDLEIVEMHHRLKKDAPSGTAQKLAEILSEARKLDAQKDIAHGRHGMIGERPKGQIGMHSLRGGDAVGDHEVLFAGPGEHLVLTHRASSRETFARGALRAARWIVGKQPGLYTMEDVLGLSSARP